MNRLSLEEFKQSRKLPLVVVLDDVRSLYNVGSVFRLVRCFPYRGDLPLWNNGYTSQYRDTQDGFRS